MYFRVLTIDSTLHLSKADIRLNKKNIAQFTGN